MNKLTIKQEKFCQEIVSGKHQFEWQAYEAVYGTKNMGKNTMYVNTSRMLSDTKISLRISELRKPAEKKLEVTLIQVLEKLAELLNFNLKTIFNPDGTMKQIHEMTDQEASCIQDYQVEEIWGRVDGGRQQIGVLKKVKLVDRLGVIDKQLRRMGAYIENHNHKFDQNDLSHIFEIVNSIK